MIGSGKGTVYTSTSSGSGKQLLHQAALVGLEGVELLGFSGDQGVEAAQARGDAVLLGKLWNEEPHRREQAFVDDGDRLPSRE